MNTSLSLGSLIANASPVVQLVILALVLASLISWVMIFERFFSFRSRHAELQDFDQRFWSGMDLSQLYTE